MLLYILIYYTCIDDCFSGIEIFVIRVCSDYHSKDESVYQRRSQIAFRMDDLFTVHLSNALYKSALWGLRPSLRAQHIKTTFWYIFYALNSQCNDEILWTILFVPYTRINVYPWTNSAITMLIRVSKNDTVSFHPRRENVHILLYWCAWNSIVIKQNAKKVIWKFWVLLMQISLLERGVRKHFIPGLRKIYRLSSVRNLKSLLLSVPRELRVRRGGKYIARKSGSPQLFSSSILVINFQVVQQRPGTQERCYRRCSRTRRVVTQGTLTTLRTY